MNFSGINPLSPSSPSSSIEASESKSLEKITTLMKEASGVNHLDDKRKKYNEAYSIILKSVNLSGPEKLSPELLKKFCELLEAYASQTCYNQGEDGFRKTAHLCELAVCQILRTIKYEAPDYNWEDHKDLESLAKSLEEASNDGDKTLYKGKFFDFVAHITADEKALSARASNYDLRQTAAQTFLRLSFSLQNIDQYKSTSETNYQLHNRFNDLTDALINDGTPDQKYQALYFAYNRCGFMVDLKVIDESEKRELKLKNYDLIGKKIKEVLGDHPDAISMLAQIENQMGLLTIDDKKPSSLKQALPLFKHALETRKPLFEVFKDVPSKIVQQNCLYANATNGVIHCLVKGDKVTQADINEAQQHVKVLEKHLQDLRDRGDQNTYGTTWQKAINKVNEAKVTG